MCVCVSVRACHVHILYLYMLVGRYCICRYNIVGMGATNWMAFTTRPGELEEPVEHLLCPSGCAKPWSPSLAQQLSQGLSGGRRLGWIRLCDASSALCFGNHGHFVTFFWFLQSIRNSWIDWRCMNMKKRACLRAEYRRNMDFGTLAPWRVGNRVFFLGMIKPLGK